jgi:uncharacterized protein DUF6694
VNANLARLVVLVLFAWGSVASCKDAIRIDGSSDDAANRSFQRMMESLKPDQQQALAIALIQINLGGAQSAQDMLRNPNMQHPSAGQVRDKIAGMTAPEIIAFANKTATTKAFIQGQEPGVPKELLRPLVGGPPSTSLADTVWILEDNINGNTKRDVYELHADHTMTLIESDKTPNGAARWEQAGDEVRLSFGDGYAVKLGRLVDATTMKGDGGNKVGFRWTWTATRR